MDTTPNAAFAATLAAPASTQGPPFQMGEVIGGKFSVEKLLGEGTFGWVYSAADGEHRVALKVLKPEHATVDAIVARFKQRELKLLLEVHRQRPSPNVVRAAEETVLHHKGYMILALEFVEGPSLTDVLTKQRQLDVDDARDIAAGIARGLAAIHAAGGVHRDLKPDNIRLRGGVEPVLLDLGIAKAMWETNKLTGTDQRLMTPYYASPEQMLSPQEVGPPSDVYALGLILFEMLVGIVPLSGPSYPELFRARTTQPPPDPRMSGRAVPDDLAQLTVRCLDRAADRRPTSQQLVDLLSRPASPPARRPPRRLLAAFAIIPVSALAAFVGWRWTQAEPNPQGPAASTGVGLSAPPASVSAPPAPPAPELRVAMVTTKLRHGEKLTFSLAADRKLFVALVAIDESGAGALLLPCRGAPNASVEPGRDLAFPKDVKAKGTAPVVAQVPRGKKETREKLFVVGFERQEDLAKRLPPNATKKEISSLSPAELSLLTNDTNASEGAVSALVSYEIAR